MSERKPPAGTKEPSVRIAEAVFPKPFYQGLEFNAPAHGKWNIVHIGMLLPEARQIYVCAANCMRGVVLTAAEMNAQDRFSFVLLEEDDMTLSNIDDVTIEGVTHCIEKLEHRPPVVLLFTVCVHHFLGADLDYIYAALGKRFPDIRFVRCFMDPMMQKTGPTPDQKLRSAMYDPIEPLPAEKSRISLIGTEVPLWESADLCRILDLFYEVSGNRVRLSELPLCKTYADYLAMGESAFFLASQADAKDALIRLSGRLARPSCYLPASFDPAEIRREWFCLWDMLLRHCTDSADHAENMSPADQAEYIKDRAGDEKDALKGKMDFSFPRFSDLRNIRLQDTLDSLENACKNALSALKSELGAAEIWVDSSFHPRPFGLAALLLEHGLHVTRIYADAVPAEEEAVFRALQEKYPAVLVCSSVHLDNRILPRTHTHVLAVGQRAAWFAGTKHFVDGSQGAGLFGFDGILRLCELLSEAGRTEKDTEKLIVRKGWGCSSCI